MGAMTAGQLGKLTQLTTGAVTGVIDRLERAGYVRRESDPNDRRKVIIQPLQEPIEREIYPFFDSTSQAMAGLYSSYSEAELAVIADFVHRTNQIALEATTKLKATTTKKLEK